MTRRKMKRTTDARIKTALRLLWLRSPERAAALKATGYKCGKCGIKQTKAGKKEEHVTLNVHHTEGINWDFLEKIRQQLFEGEQIALCRNCHKQAHRDMDGT